MKTTAVSYRLIVLLILIATISTACVSNRPSSAYEMQRSYFQGSAAAPKAGYCGGRCDR